ncbi:MAG TPA: hypothetical protein VEI97_15450, partial [bacterium]|nr:hypothetical protein [bacterium]
AQYTNFDLRLRSTINWTYDLRDSQTQQLTAQTDWFIRRDLDTTFRLAYDTVGRNRDILQELSLTKRFDCTFMQLTYRAQGDVFLLQAGVTAYPGQTIGYGLNADTLLNNPFAQFGDNLGATPGGFTGFGNTFGTGGFDTGF